MKADYKKPMLNVEFFTLTQTIARDCGGSIPGDDVSFNNLEECLRWDLGDGSTVFSEILNCSIEGGDADYGCYNNPNEGNYIFRS